MSMMTCTTLDHVYPIDPITNTILLKTPCFCKARTWGQPGRGGGGRPAVQTAPLAALDVPRRAIPPPRMAVPPPAATAAPVPTHGAGITMPVLPIRRES